MRSMQVNTTQLQDASATQLEVLRVRSRELRLRTSDLQAREQQLREVRFQSPPGPEREKVDRQWLEARHNSTAASLELEGVTERITELQRQRDQARVVAVQAPPPRYPDPPPVETPDFSRAWIGMMLLLAVPIVIILLQRALTRSSARYPYDIESSPRLQRLEQTVESIAMEVERIAEGQRFTTKVLAERHPAGYPDAIAAATTRPPGQDTPPAR